MLHLKGKLLEVNSDNVVVEQENGYKQKVEFTESKVSNKEGLKEILKMPIESDVVLGVLAFPVAYLKDKKAKGFVKFVLNGDFVK